MAGNEKCKSNKHVFHLCALKDCGLGENDKVFSELTSNPQFKCAICGDAADKADSLCDPKKIHAQNS